MPKENKQLTIILTTVVAITGGLVYFGYKKYQKYNQLAKARKIKDEGNKMFKDKKYDKALEKYHESIKYTEKGDQEHMNILNNISLTYFLLKKYKESLSYSDKYLNIDKMNIKILKRRFETNRNLENNTETITDAFILSILDTEKFSTLGKTTLGNIVEKISDQKMEDIEVFPGEINVLEYFETFPEISKVYYNHTNNDEKNNDQEKEKSSERILTYKDYKRIYKKNEDTNSAVLFIKASIEHLMGRNEKAYDLIKTDIFYYSVILREYLSVNIGEKKKSKEFKDVLKSKPDNFSVLFYNTLISLQLQEKEYLTSLEQGINLYPKQFLLLKMVFLIQSKEYSTLENLIDNIKEFSIPICAISCEYYIMVKKFDPIMKMLEIMNKIDKKDPRIPLFKGMLKEAKDESNADLDYSKCIDLDPTFVKPYILLGNYLMQNNDEKCEEVFQNGLEYAFQREDISSFIGSLLLWDVQKICTKRYPELFKNEVQK